MRILKFEAENIKKLKVVSITPQGNVVEVTGANGQGKSSVLDAIFYALGGTAGVPSQPIHTGAEKGFVRLDLGDITVTRRFTATDSSLIVEAKNGARFPSPQKMLDELLGKLTFDPLAFSRMEPKKQLEAIRGIVKLDVDIDAIDADNKRLFEKRTDLNRQVKTLDAQAAAITVVDGTPDTQVDISALVNELEAAGEANLSIQKEKQKVWDLQKSAQSDRDGAKRLEAHAVELEVEVKSCREQAVELEKSANEKAEKVAMSEVSMPIDTAELKAKIETARAVNDQIAAKVRRNNLWDQAKCFRIGVGDVENLMSAANQKKLAAISTAKMPIEGLSFGDGQVVYNGLPLEQASSAEKLRVSVAVAMAANPKLKVIRVQDGSLLDDASMKLLADMAAASDYQVWIETVHSTSKTAVVMEDGEVKA